MGSPNRDIYYSIESKDTYYGDVFRFRSLFNDAIGTWTYNQDYAIYQGKQHTKLIKQLIKGELNANTT